MLKKSAQFLFLMLVFSSNSFAQNGEYSLTGVVIDGKSKETIPQAVISIAPSNRYTYSNLKGEFFLKDLKKGDYVLSIKSLGHVDYIKLISVNGSHEKLKIEMKEDITILKEMVVVQDKSLDSEEERIETEGYAVNSISTRDVKNQSLEVNTLIDQAPGISVRQTGGLGSRSEYTINGLSGNAVRFFIDGIPMEYYGSSYSVNSLPISLIDNVEIYKGVVPVSLGADALGGAVNVRTHKEAKSSLNASYTIGSFGTHQVALSGNWTNPKSNFVIRGSAFYNHTDNNYKVWGNDVYVSDPQTGTIDRTVTAERFNDKFENFGAKVDFGWVNKKWADQFLFSVLYSDMYKEVQHGATMEVPFGERFYVQQTVMPSLSYQKKNLFITGLDFDFFAGYSIQSRQVVDTTKNKYNWYGDLIKVMPEGGESGTATLAVADESTLINRINIGYRLNDKNVFSFNVIKTGFNRVNDDEMAAIGSRTYDNHQRVDKTLMGIGYQNQSFNNRLKTNLFAKSYGYNIDVRDTEFENNVYVPYDYSKKENNYGYGLALSYDLSKKWIFQTSYENAIRLPSPNEVFGNVAENILEGHELSPERSQNVNLGLRYKRVQYGKYKLIITGNVFYRDVRGLIQQSTVVVSGVDYFYYENLSKIISKGVDFDVKYSYKKRFNLSVSGSYTDARDKNKYAPDGRQSWSYNSRLKNAPYLQFNTGVRFNFENFLQEKSNTSFYWNARYVHEFYRHWENIGKYAKDIIPTQFVNSVGVSYRFPKKKLSISLDFRNVFNEQVFDNFAIQQPGRGFYCKLNYKIF